MEQREFTQKLLALGVCPFVLASFTCSETPAAPMDDNKKLLQLKMEKEFVENWLADLLDSMDKLLDHDTQVKLIENCGRACYNRFQFKKDIAAKGSGNVDKLIEAYSQNFEIWKDGENVHIRYGKKSPGCYCPAAKYREPKTNDLHCECTRTTHQTIFETALGKPFKVDIAETVRRGGQTCHFIVHLT